MFKPIFHILFRMPFPDDRGILVTYSGGLGNQIWQVAAGFAAARAHGCPLYLPQNPIENNKHNRFRQDYRNTVFSRLGERLEMPVGGAVVMAEAAGWVRHTCPGFEEWRPHDIQPGTIMTSYYQYYPGISRFNDELRELFLEGLGEQLNYVRYAFNPNTTFAFLHIRRGDYLNAPNFHYIQPIEYYRWCIADLLRKRPDISRILIFTDDVGWARRHAFFKRKIFQSVDIPNELESLALMSCCGGGAICANSTFSWWGAFLTGSENVYVPERWIAEPIVCLFPNTWAIVSSEMYRTEIQSNDTVFVTLTDAGYFEKAKRTIRETRERGGWGGDIVLITVNFIASGTDAEFMRKYRVQEFPVQHINTDRLVAELQATPIKAMPDGRHFGKLTQWDKIYSFSPFFRRWRRVAFLDAGIRILDSVQPLLNLQWEGRFLAPDDSEPFDNGNRFRCQLDLEANPAVLTELLTEYPQSILDEKYFLNCMYVYDTSLLDSVKMDDMILAMNKYPISLCNEMGIMNLIITFKHRLWSAFPHRTSEGKYLFGWNERNYPEGPTWESFHFMKYPATV